MLSKRLLLATCTIGAFSCRSFGSSSEASNKQTRKRENTQTKKHICCPLPTDSMAVSDTLLTSPAMRAASAVDDAADDAAAEADADQPITQQPVSMPQSPLSARRHGD